MIDFRFKPFFETTFNQSNVYWRVTTHLAILRAQQLAILQGRKVFLRHSYLSFVLMSYMTFCATEFYFTQPTN